MRNTSIKIVGTIAGVLLLAPAFLQAVPQEQLPPPSVTSFGSAGDADDQFKRALNVGIDPLSNDVLIADVRRQRILRFRNDGTFVSSFGEELRTPVDVAVDSQGTVYVVDLLDDVVQVYSSAGEHLRTIGGAGTTEGRLQGPAGITVDAADAVYVADNSNSRVQKFDAEGNFVASWYLGSAANPHDMTVAADGTIYIADGLLFGIRRYDAGGNQLGVLGERCEFDPSAPAAPEPDPDVEQPDDEDEEEEEAAAAEVASCDGKFAEVSGVALDPDGNLYATDRLNRQIQKFDAAGNFLGAWTIPSGDADDGELSYASPLGISIDAMGNIFVVTASEVFRYSYR